MEFIITGSPNLFDGAQLRSDASGPQLKGFIL